MSTCSRILGIVTALPLLTHCGPEINQGPEIDPEATIAAFCETLFTCPEFYPMEEYGSPEGCEDVHWMNYEERDSTCRKRVLALEDCLSALTCQELHVYVAVGGSACDDERSHLTELCTPL